MKDLRRALYNHVIIWSMVHSHLTAAFTAPHVWQAMYKEEEDKDAAFCEFLAHTVRQKRTATVTSSNSVVTVPVRPNIARKPGQRKRAEWAGQQLLHHSSTTFQGYHVFKNKTSLFLVAFLHLSCRRNKYWNNGVGYIGRHWENVIKIHWIKKQDTIHLSVTSPNVNRFSKIFSLLDSVGNL